MKCSVCAAEMVQPIFKWYCPREDEHVSALPDPSPNVPITWRIVDGPGLWKWVEGNVKLVVHVDWQLLANVDYRADDGSYEELGPVEFVNIDGLNAWIRQLKSMESSSAIQDLPDKIVVT